MFADPISFPNYDGDLKNHVRTELGNGVGTFELSNDIVPQTVVIKQTKTSKRKRHEIRLSRTKIVADPLTALSSEQGASVYLVIDEPINGFADSDLDNMLQVLCRFLTGAVPVNTANAFRLFAGEY